MQKVIFLELYSGRRCPKMAPSEVRLGEICPIIMIIVVSIIIIIIIGKIVLHLLLG